MESELLGAHEQAKAVVAVRHLQVLGVALRRLGRVLQAREPLAGEGVEQLGGEVVAGAVGKGVGQHRRAGRGLQQRAVVVEQGLALVGVVVRGIAITASAPVPMAARARRTVRRRGRAAHVGDHLQAALRGLHRGGDHRGHLRLLEQGALAGGPAGHDPVQPVLGQQLDVQPKGVEIESAVPAEGGRQSGVYLKGHSLCPTTLPGIRRPGAKSGYATCARAGRFTHAGFVHLDPEAGPVGTPSAPSLRASGAGSIR